MSLYGIGLNNMSQLGLPYEVETCTELTKLSYFNDKKIVRMVSGSLHTLVLCENNRLYSWGVNDDYSLGRDGNEEVPEEVLFKETIVDMAAGSSYSALLTKKGQVFCCGTFKSESGPIGIVEDKKFLEKFQRIKGLKGIKKIAGGKNHLICIDSLNRIWTFGRNDCNQLGTSLNKRYVKRCLIPTQITTKRPKNENNVFLDAAGGGYHSMALNEIHEVLGWGSNMNHQLGRDEQVCTMKRIPIIVPDIKYLSLGTNHSLFLSTKNESYGCGNNSDGQLGIENRKYIIKPELIMENVERIEAGDEYSVFITEDKKLYISGYVGFNDVEFKKPTLIDTKDIEIEKLEHIACGNDFIFFAVNEEDKNAENKNKEVKEPSSRNDENIAKSKSTAKKDGKLDSSHSKSKNNNEKVKKSKIKKH